MMDKNHRDLLQSNYVYLIEDINNKDKLEEICMILYQKKIIITPMKDKILSQKTQMTKSSALLDLLPQRGTRAFNAFYDACKFCKLVDSADRLKPERAPHRLVSNPSSNGSSVISSKDEQPLPDTWPTEEHFENVWRKTISVINVSKESNPEGLRDYETHLNRVGLMYPMYHSKRGKALIINNNVFPLSPSLSSRDGSELDEKGLAILFKGLGFDVEVKQNLNGENLKKAIENEAKADHKKHDCFVLFIMTHGKQSVVLGTDGSGVQIKFIIDSFKDVDDLKGKPKLFFFQSCQGDFEDKGKRINVKSQQAEEDEEIHPLRSSPEPQGAEAKVTESLDIPVNRDIFLFRSAPDDQRAIRHTKFGSWFTQAIIFVFCNYAHRCHIVDLFATTNKLLAKAKSSTGTKNIGEIKFDSTKKLYFFPGLSESDAS